LIFSPLVLQRYWTWILIVACAVVVFCVACSLAFGAVPLSVDQLFTLFLGVPDAQAEMIVRELRLPRSLLAVCVGALLATCGAVTQGFFRNPLADPSLIGVSAGAAAGASTVIVLLNTFQWSIAGLSLVSLGAFLGGVLAVMFVYRIATGASGTSVATMLLAGIAITFLAGSISSVFEFIADNEMLRRISLWRMGALDAADYPRVSIIFLVCLVIFACLPKQYAALNALLLGESEARHLGIDVHAVKKRIIIIVAAGVGTSVALAGTISFIGLVIPHIVRIFVGPNHRYLIPLSACAGAVLLLIADAFARSIIAPTELPVGLMTAVIGAPVFISLLRQRHRYGMQ